MPTVSPVGMSARIPGEYLSSRVRQCFIFKCEEGDRGDARRFFQTIELDYQPVYMNRHKGGMAA